MRIKILIIFIINLLLLVNGRNLVFAMEHTQMNGLFSMDIPDEWHWVETPQQVVITYHNGKTTAIDIQLVPSRNLSQVDIKKILKKSNDKIIKEGIKAHNGILIDNKKMKFNGVYATRLDFKTSPPSPVYVTYISFFNKGYAFTITYGCKVEKTHFLMDDVLSTFKFK
jgi:hypothetical protein